MRLKALKESAPGKKGITTLDDARVWLAACKDGSASAQDMEMYKNINAALKFGGKTTVFNVVGLMTGKLK